MNRTTLARLRLAGLDAVARKVIAGERLDAEDGLRLFRTADVGALGALADLARRRLHGDVVTFNRNLHINATNVCEADCTFCSFARSADDPEAAGAWTLSAEQAVARLRREGDAFLTEVHVVNGLNPYLPFRYYTDLLRALKAERPDLHVKGFTAVEIAYFADKYGMSVEAVLRELVAAGLDSLPGGGAEIFAEGARRRLCGAPPREEAAEGRRATPKVGADRWLDVHRTAHRLGLRSNCTMLFGAVESLEDRVDHLLRLRALQDETGGFQCFIPLRYHAANNRMARLGETTGIDVLRTFAASRLILDNVPHLKAYWPMLGVGIAQAALHFGADDLDGTVREERIYHMAGATTPQGLSRAELARLIRHAGRVPAERDTLYRVVRWADEDAGGAAAAPAAGEPGGRDAGAASALAGLRLAVVGYLNALPLVRELGGARLLAGHPSEVARALVEGRADAGLVPVGALLAEPGLAGFRVVPDLAIGCDGPVDSVLLVAETPPERWRRVVLDGASRTSAILARLLLAERAGAMGLAGPVEIVEAPAGAALERAGGETAALVIGDAARALDARWTVRLDLGAAWRAWTGLPFVFAVWAGRPDLDPAAVAAIRAAGRAGLAALDAGRLVRDPEDRRYLVERIRYALDDRATAGLRRFAALAHAAGLLPRRSWSLHAPPTPRRRRVRDVDALLAKGAEGGRLGFDEAMVLERHAPHQDLLAAAHLRRMALHPTREVTYIVSRNVNYTNVCTVACRFCAFWRSRRHDEAYVLDREAMAARLDELVAHGGVEVLLQGGLHPDLDIAWYEDLFRWIKARWPLDLHALSPDEVTHIARVSGLSVGETLDRLVAAGLDSVPGGGAEILVDEVRRRIARGKTSAGEWLDVMRQAHARGLKASCTMMYGVGERPEHRVTHLLRLRELQDESLARRNGGGFTAFICWPFQAGPTRLEPGNVSAAEWLRVNALSRLVLDNIANVQASWVTQGPGLAEASLWGGCNDFGSVMLEENVVSAAGTTFRMTIADVERSIRAAGFTPVRRNMSYDHLPGARSAGGAEPAPPPAK